MAGSLPLPLRPAPTLASRNAGPAGGTQMACAVAWGVNSLERCDDSAHLLQFAMEALVLGLQGGDDRVDSIHWESVAGVIRSRAPHQAPGLWEWQVAQQRFWRCQRQRSGQCHPRKPQAQAIHHFWMGLIHTFGCTGTAQERNEVKQPAEPEPPLLLDSKKQRTDPQRKPLHSRNGARQKSGPSRQRL